MKKEKILLVHNFYQIGGGEHTVFENEKQLLLENGHEIIEYTRHNNEIKGIKGKLLLPFITVFNFRSYFEVKKIIREENIDIMHCHNTFPIISPSVYYAADRLGVPVVQTIHNFRLLCPNGIFYTQGKICEDCTTKGLQCSIRKRCYRDSIIGSAVVASMLKIHRLLGTYRNKVDKYIALTEFNKHKLSQIVPSEKIVVKPNFTYVLPNENKIEKKKQFIFVGRLEENKGIKFVIDSWLPEFEKLIIIGDGTLKKYVEKVTNRVNNIEYLGVQSHQFVLQEISKSKAFIFASEWYEGFPMVILEAMAQETAIIVPNIGNAASIVNDQIFGLHYKNKDVIDFQKVVKNLSDDIDCKNLGKAASTVFNSNFTAIRNYVELQKIYKEVRESE